MRYVATIKWLDNGTIQEDMIFKVGDIEDDDDNIFFYLQSEDEINSLKTEGIEDFIIISYTEE